MPERPQEVASNPVETSVRDDKTNIEKVFPHADPTFYEVARRLDWGHNNWTLIGPSFADGTRPMFQIEWRLGELILKFLMRYANAKLSRTQRDQMKKGEPLERIRLVKKTTPAAVTEFGDQDSNGGTNIIPIHKEDQ